MLTLVVPFIKKIEQIIATLLCYFIPIASFMSKFLNQFFVEIMLLPCFYKSQTTD